MLTRHTRFFRLTASLVLAAFTGVGSVAQAAPDNYVRLSLAYTSPDHPADATLYFASLDGDAVLAGGPARFEGHLTDNATGANHPYAVEIPAHILDSITLDSVPALEDSDEEVYEIYQDGDRVPVTLYMETTADPLKANSYVHTGTFYFEDTGKVVSFSALNDPIPVVVIVGGALVLLLCGANIIGDLVNSCAKRAAAACAPNGVKSCVAEITAWSLLMGCSSNCRFTCFPPAPAPGPGIGPRPQIKKLEVQPWDAR